MRLLVQGSFKSVERLRLGSFRKILGSKHLYFRMQPPPQTNPEPTTMNVILKFILECGLQHFEPRFKVWRQLPSFRRINITEFLKDWVFIWGEVFKINTKV